jgi:hypothetical protein
MIAAGYLVALFVLGRPDDGVATEDRAVGGYRVDTGDRSLAGAGFMRTVRVPIGRGSLSWSS